MAVASFAFDQLVVAAGDSSAAGSALLDQLDAALIDPGAFRMSDLPISDAMVDEMHEVTREFFELPLETKTRYRYIDDQYVGWCGAQFLSQYGTADRKEMFHIGPRVAPTLPVHLADGTVATVDPAIAARALASCSLWPEAPDTFIEVWHRYYRAMQEVSASLGAVLAKILGIDPAEWFDALQGNWADLAANYYPPIGEEEGGSKPVYNAAHRDLTIFTILHQDQSRAGGLSVEMADGSWEKVEPVPGTYVVNVGELLTYLSGGRWRAAPHQVTVSVESQASSDPRISVPFFYRPNDARVVRSFVDRNATPIAVGDWVIERKKGARSSAS